MRRADKQINSEETISEIIRTAMVCRIALSKDNQPYIVPVSYGYDGDAIYFHTQSKGGLKLEYLAANNQVCFEIEDNVNLIRHDEKPCEWSFTFQSVIGFGKVTELAQDEEKIEGLQHIMRHYSKKDWGFEGIPLAAVAVWKITIDSVTGKQSLNFTKSGS
jgi:nitroimidazol reductase NimA-like FMN-containing flavoprotein (pyridoxamine 5'-phosphate oxidase superfamily)